MIILDNLDRRIISYISKKSAHSSLLHVELGEPRTTIAFRLNRLKKFNRVEKYTEGRKTMWRLPFARTHNKELIHVFKGNAFIECYKQIETLEKESVIYAIQGKEAARGEFKNVPEDLMLHIHKLMKRRKILMRALANETILEELLSITEKLRKSHEGRVQSIKLLDSRFLSAGELFVSRSFIFIVNPYKKIGVVIKEKAMISLFYDLLQLVFSLSDRLQNFDLNKYIRDTGRK